MARLLKPQREMEAPLGEQPIELRLSDEGLGLHAGGPLEQRPGQRVVRPEHHSPAPSL
jgi:hypothetical protein